MVWFKVDDTLPHHAKVLAAGNSAMGLWVRAGAWSMQQLTDGFIPSHVAPTLGSTTDAKRLVTSGLWLTVDDGYQFHEWDQRQPLRDKVESDRDAATERQRMAREKAKSQRESQRDIHRDSRQESRSPMSRSPRPDPTRPDQEAKASSEGARKRATQLPDDWMPDETVREAMKAECPNVDFKTEHAKFQDYWHGTGKPMKDWTAVWRNWIRKADEYRKQRSKVTHINGQQPVKYGLENLNLTNESPAPPRESLPW